MIERLSKNPIKHLSMLELLYLCLSLGFEGKYRVQTRGMVELESLRDALYRLICQTRGDTLVNCRPTGKASKARGAARCALSRPGR